MHLGFGGLGCCLFLGNGSVVVVDSLFNVPRNDMGFCVWSLFSCALLCVLSSFAFILPCKMELVALP